MSSVIFWVAWIIIPLIMEVIPTVGNFYHPVKTQDHEEEI